MDIRDKIIKYIKMFPYSHSYSYIPDFFRGFPNEKKPALEKQDSAIAQQNYLVDSFLKNKLQFHEWNLDTLKNLLLLRLNIHYDNKYNIEYRIGETRNQLVQILQFPNACSDGMLQRRTELDKLVANLYQQKNTEQSNLWRDLNVLQKDILNGLKYYKNLSNIQKIFTE